MPLPKDSSLLNRHPNLLPYLEKEQFLTGFTQGGQKGQIIFVFLMPSPWREYIVEAKAMEVIPSGGVLLVCQENPWYSQSNWQAFHCQEKLLSMNNRSSHDLAKIATQIAIKERQSLRKTVNH